MKLLKKGAHIFIKGYACMGSVLSHQLCQRKSKPRINHGHRTTEEVSTLNDNDISSSGINFVEEFVLERYLVLLTEQMTEMIFRLMTCNETSIKMSENSSDYRTTLGMNVGNGNMSTSIIIPNSKSNNDRSSLHLQSMHQSCIKCKMKMLTIEEFRELHNAFRRVDSDHDNFLTRDEIRMTLNYLFELTEYDIKEIISVFDTNKDERISFEEYIGIKAFP
jgi:hypothetical protein